jgi:23S rRNA pseudouridine1911/1915/1917 synthase
VIALAAGEDAEESFTAVVDERADGMRLDRFLAGPLGSRARAARLIDAGLARVDGRPCAKSSLLSAGQRVSVAAPAASAAAAEPQAVSFGIAYEDEHLLIVDKPAGVVVHPGAGHTTGTLAQALTGRAAGGEEHWRAGIVHRLDRDTSGLLVVAKSDAVHRALQEQLARRALRREYLALIEGVPPARSGTIEAPIGRSRRDRVLMSIDTDAPREATTHFELLETLGDCTLVRVALDTGRTHQIRVHMAAIGHPVCADRQYGGARRHGLERQFLHAARLAFAHPVTGAAIDIRSPLPADLESALRAARASGASRR